MDKILVLYPNEANLDEILEKANKQNAKIGPLSAVVLLGPRLPPTPPKVSPTAPTYFFSDQGKEGQFSDIASNYTCIHAPASSPAFLRLPSNITLAFIDDSVKVENDKECPEINVLADILFTYHWPSAIAASEKLSLVANRALDPVVKQLQPRYHFSAGAGGRRYEPAPFSWSPQRLCRFVSLAKEGSGEKWFYAFMISNAADEPKEGPNPYEIAKRKREEPEFVQDKQARVQERGPRHVSPLECFFCLANPKLESHMIVSIGQFSYVTIAKGPLTRQSRALGMAGHGIIIPIDHRPKLAFADLNLVKEIADFKNSLVRMFDAHNHDVVFFDFNRDDNVHYHIQFIPVPRGVLGPDAADFKSVLDEKVQYHNDNFSRNSELHFKEDHDKSYEGDSLRFSIYINNKKLALVSALHGPVDLQLPRRVMAILLRMPKRIKWDRCRQSQAQETQECEQFKQVFSPFDPTQGH